jgi:hypothetical protein
MARKTGGQLGDNGRVVKGRMPKGSLEEPMTIKDGPFRVFRKKGR